MEELKMSDLTIELTRILPKYTEKELLPFIDDLAGQHNLSQIIIDHVFFVKLVDYITAKSISTGKIFPAVGSAMEIGLIYGYLIGKYLEAKNGKA